jgi:hypothetical protein
MAQDRPAGIDIPAYTGGMMALIALQSLVRVLRGRGFNGQYYHSPARQ